MCSVGTSTVLAVTGQQIAAQRIISRLCTHVLKFNIDFFHFMLKCISKQTSVCEILDVNYNSEIRKEIETDV